MSPELSPEPEFTTGSLPGMVPFRIPVYVNIDLDSMVSLVFELACNSNPSATLLTWVRILPKDMPFFSLNSPWHKVIGELLGAPSVANTRALLGNQ